MAITLLNRNPALGCKIDLRAELNSLVNTDKRGASQVKNLLSDELQKGFNFKIIRELQTEGQKDIWACDGDNFYVLNEKSLYKVGRKERTARLLITNDDIGQE